MTLGILLAALGRNHRAPAPQPAQSANGGISSSSSFPRAPAQAPESAASGHTTRLVQGLLGDELRVELSREGRLASIRGRVGSGNPSSGEFDPRSSQQALERAQEILGMTRELIGVSEEFPLGGAEVHPGEFSAQVYFAQMSREGIPVEPGGKVSLSLGTRGELIGLDSDYRADLESVAGARVISSAAGAFSVQSALEAEGQSGAAARISGGRPVLWAGQGGRPRPAYEYSADGRRYFVDAQDGRILARRDERQLVAEAFNQSPSEEVSESRRKVSAPAAAGDCVRCPR